jgi:hypothetical protein
MMIGAWPSGYGAKMSENMNNVPCLTNPGNGSVLALKLARVMSAASSGIAMI